MITKHKLNFDPAEGDDYDVVASFLKSSDGTLITHTTASGKEALDVNIAASDIQIEVDLYHTEDSVRLGDGTSFYTSTSENSDIALDVHISNSNVEVTQGTDPWVIGDGGNSITVDAVDLDIRDLAFGTDSVDVSGSEVSLDAATLAALETINAVQSGTWIIDSITNDVNVTATDLDIRDLTHASDSVKIGDGTDFLAVESDGSINVNSTENGYSSCNNPAAVSVTTSATDLLVTELSNRKEITIQNTGAKDAYIGCDSGVTAAKGLLVPKGATATFKFGASINVHAITPAGSTELRILELA